MAGSDEDDRFDALMNSIGVVPLSESRAMRRKRRQTPDAELPPPRVDPLDNAEAEFAAAMAALDGVVDKDLPPPEHASPPPDRVARLKLAPRATLRIDDTLDLHGLTQEESVRRLDLFVRNAFVARMSRLVIVTGKGHHSKGQRGVLRPLVEGWLQTDGAPFVAAFGAAPRPHGGDGAFVVELRQSRGSAARRRRTTVEES